MVKNKSDIIIINAFPKDEGKILLLTEQLMYLKKLNKPILLVSGCPVPEFIENKVDYLIVNTENEIIGKDYSNYLRENDIHDFAFDRISDSNREFWFYWSNVNSTITKNIKLGFNLAKLLGYETAFYTEDDNIWKDGSFEYINDNLNKLNEGVYKMSGIIGEQVGLGEPMIFTTFFFANVDYFYDTFTIPHNAEEWYDLNNIKNYKLSKTYETLFYHFFKKDLHIFYNTKTQFDELLEPKLIKIGLGLNDRRHSEKNLLNTFFTVLPTKNKEKMLVLLNRSDYLKTGGKQYNATIYYDGVYNFKNTTNPMEYHIRLIPNEIKKIKIEIEGYGNIEIDCDLNSIVNNGLFFYNVI
jgi:hypothetical protein